MKNSTTFRIKDKKRHGSHILTKGMSKKQGILKSISYRPGASSIYDEDNKKSAARRKSVVFKYNEKKHDPALEIDVPNANSLLLQFLLEHQDFGKVYEIYNEDQVNLDKVAKFGKIEKALGYIGDGGDDEIKASALTVFGLEYFVRSIAKCKIALKEKAMTDPDTIIRAYEAPNFYNKYMVSLMYCSGVIKNNDSHTAVQWADTGNAILTVATGESGIEKLTEFISRENSDSITLLQEFQARYEQLEQKKKEAKFDSSTAKKELSEKDKEIAELKKLLAAKEEVVTDTVDKYKDVTLDEAVALYKELKGEEVPTSKLTNLAWILKQLREIK